MDLEVVLRGVLPPIVAALLLVSLGGARLTAVAAAVGLFVAYGLLKKAWPELPHVLWHDPNGTEWLLWGVATAALVALAEHFRVLPRRAGHTVGAVCGCVVVWFVLVKVAAHWSPTETLLAVGGGALIVLLILLGVRIVLVRAPSGVFPAILFTVVLSIDAAVLTLGGSALLGQLCGALAAALGAAIGTALWRRPFTLTVADGTWLAIAHGAFLLAGVHLADVPWSAAACAMIAPLALLPLREGLGSQKPMLWAILATTLTLVPMVGAIWFAMGDSSQGY